MARHVFTARVRHTSVSPAGVERRIDFVNGRDTVPALSLSPDGSDGPHAMVVLLHGFSSRKERMMQTIGLALLARGVGSLALDLPFHGERSPAGGGIPQHPLVLVSAWRSAVSEACAAVDWLEHQPGVDAARLGVLGYSLGGFLALMAASEEPHLGVVVLVAAGDLPYATPYAAMVRTLIDPPRVVQRLAGRPLLLVNGRHDRTTRPAQAERLFAAAREPKTLMCYDGGHWPPPAAIDAAAEWMQDKLDGRLPAPVAPPGHLAELLAPEREH